jgi:hypothetical protein
MRVMHMTSIVVAAKVKPLTGGDGIGRFGQRADEHARWIVARVLPLDLYSYILSPTWRNI